jgi:hypothetical protein
MEEKDRQPINVRAPVLREHIALLERLNLLHLVPQEGIRISLRKMRAKIAMPVILVKRVPIRRLKTCVLLEHTAHRDLRSVRTAQQGNMELSTF